MARPFRQQVDEGILDRAAALFARRGFAKTSVQDVADAVGLSKAGLLHHFPTKDVLYAAVVAQADTLAARVLDQLGDLPAGPERDRRAVETMVDVALGHPGLVALLLAPAIQSGVDPAAPIADGPLRVFVEDPETAPPERLVRVLGAYAALAVLTLAAHQQDRTTAWRRHIVATCLDALGSAEPTTATVAPRPHPEPNEA
ncbi:TetR/AcrR family transcriptional regulator [Trujillonella endophytica]|uniref:Transcriptional regulator, TetR family n=1 Tax=Trujillonella endophytica TaxID=673521 RepID=A0A1H8RVV0_9ACTN|nr:TetR/AcrR family transcriptional regulator [Trujillella endophytica]SEO70475.1 transcriptional regulator, TetR family [Trujillella endophytica]